ncbi:MAG: NADH-quinone oxidoreductase subunit G, partial [Burkholderiaceae bacterium]|nr:NADH-quinone oxidoreductase subunit G [Burkholderiaceae bacterium]
LKGFDFETSQEVLAEALGDVSTLPNRLSNASHAALSVPAVAAASLERVADVPIYSTDALVRRAAALQLTADAKAPVAEVAPELWQRLGLAPGGKVRVSQGSAQAVLPVRVNTKLGAGVVRVPAGHADTAGLGAMFGPLEVEKV